MTDQPVVNGQHHSQAFLMALIAAFAIHIVTLNPEVNLGLFHTINQSHLWVPEVVIAMLNDLGNGVTLGAVALCYLVKYPQRTGQVLLAAVLSLIIVPTLKQYFDAQRPAAVLQQLTIIGQAHYSNSFPSGHTATIFLFAGLYYIHKPHRLLRITALSLAFVVGASRIAAGAHWPEDVALGAVVGLICAFAAVNLCGSWSLSKSKQLVCYLLILTVLVTVELGSGHDFADFPPVQWMRWSLIVYSGMMVSHFIWVAFDCKAKVKLRFGQKAREFGRSGIIK
ncbi:phosphatase PAP2 family protein [Shewanella waksmanii]|uniref:phosphatase PAP2 family protein n=1 Tax=Shewanella waksmanii TaxID=213783 RepID=UPI00373641F1